MARMMEITFRRKTGIGHEILGFKSACTISVPAAGRKSTIRRLTISSHALLSARIPLSDSVMLVSGRASFRAESFDGEHSYVGCCRWWPLVV